MRETFPTADARDPVREVGLAMAAAATSNRPDRRRRRRAGRAYDRAGLARRYIRESRRDLEPRRRADHRLRDRRRARRRADRGRRPATVAGRVWVHSIDADPQRQQDLRAGDIVVVGNRADAQRQSIELGAALLVAQQRDASPTRRSSVWPRETRHRGHRQPARLLRQQPDGHAGRAVRGDGGPRSADRRSRRPDQRHLRADQGRPLPGRGRGRRARRPVGLHHPSRSGLPDPAPGDARRPRRAGAERARRSSRPRSSRSSTTTTSARSRPAFPVTATFDPVGSTATLVVERFVSNGIEPSAPTAMMLLCAVLSDTVLLNSPTTTDARPRGRRTTSRSCSTSTRWSSDARCSRRPPTSRRRLRQRDRHPRRQGVRAAPAARRSRSPRSRPSAPGSCSAASRAARARSQEVRERNDYRWRR